MGRKRTSGLYKRSGVWHIDKIIFEQRVTETTRTSNLNEAQNYLAHHIEEICQAKVYGVSPQRTFKEDATKFLRENMHKRSIDDDASKLRNYFRPLVIFHCSRFTTQHSHLTSTYVGSKD